jgi:hypothetical protein
MVLRLSGISPFHGKNYQDVLAKNKQCVITYPEYYWTNVSAEGKVENSSEINREGISC